MIVATSVACSPKAPAQARAALRDGLRGLVSELTVDAVVLAASELVSNCVRHAGLIDDELIDISVRHDDENLCLEVCDGGPGFDSPPTSDPEDAAHQQQTSGRGLRIVNTLAINWGTGRAHDKSTVWVLLDITGE